MAERKNLSDLELQNLANQIKTVGGLSTPSVTKRSEEFNKGKTPSLTNIYLARMTGNIEREEAEDLNPNYQPERIHVTKDKHRTSGKKTRTQAQMYEGVLKASNRYKGFLKGKKGTE